MNALGENYQVVLPVIGSQTITVPVSAIVHDATGYALDDLKARAKANLPLFIGLGLGVVAIAILIRRI